MKNTIKKVKAKQNQKLKTLCTLDTTDIGYGNEVKQFIENRKAQMSLSKQKRRSLIRRQSKSQVQQKIHKIDRSIKKTIQPQWQNVLVRNKTMNSAKKQYRRKSRQRIKTQYFEDNQNKITLSNLQVFTTVKNVKFQMDEQYNVDPFYLIKTIKNSSQETISLVKILDQNKKSPYFIMKKTNHPKHLNKYQKEVQMKQQLTDHMKVNQRKNFSCVYKVYRKDKFNNMFLVYYMEGEALSWKKALHKKLIHNLPKNNLQILKHLVVELSKSIFTLSNYGYYHSQLRLKNILLELQQDQQNVKVSKQVKLANLYQCKKIKDKKDLLKMSLSIYTPPEILNFIMFQKQCDNVNRQWLEYIYKYDDAWRVNVWSLAVLVLQLLNQQPLSNVFLQIQEIIEYQLQIFKKNRYLFDKITDKGFEKILIRMLSVNPLQRPSPQQIVLALTS